MDDLCIILYCSHYLHFLNYPHGTAHGTVHGNAHGTAHGVARTVATGDTLHLMPTSVNFEVGIAHGEVVETEDCGT